MLIMLGGCGSKEGESTSEQKSESVEQSENVENTASYKDGTYQGQAVGKEGYIKVEVTVANSKIESVVILEHMETEGISDPAIETIPSKIVEAQSLDIDTVSGATVTSNAIIDAVSEALKSAS